ncbi:MAG TPA: low molecular weight protein-tyrosine-phosphatase [Rhodanobacteraceae bacterium]
MKAIPAGVLFVCLGNICRSPTAEYVARAEFARVGLALPVASRGLGDWHVGQGADPRAIAAARVAGYDLGPHRARQFALGDFAKFATVLAVDRTTLAELKRLAPRGTPVPQRLLVAAGLAQAGADGDIPDPYSGTQDDFRDTLLLIQRGVRALAARLAAQPDDRRLAHGNK